MILCVLLESTKIFTSVLLINPIIWRACGDVGSYKVVADKDRNWSGGVVTGGSLSLRERFSHEGGYISWSSLLSTMSIK